MHLHSCFPPLLTLQLPSLVFTRSLWEVVPLVGFFYKKLSNK